jgi:hypothetical protein
MEHRESIQYENLCHFHILCIYSYLHICWNNGVTRASVHAMTVGSGYGITGTPTSVASLI